MCVKDLQVQVQVQVQVHIYRYRYRYRYRFTGTGTGKDLQVPFWYSDGKPQQRLLIMILGFVCRIEPCAATGELGGRGVSDILLRGGV